MRTSGKRVLSLATRFLSGNERMGQQDEEGRRTDDLEKQDYEFSFGSIVGVLRVDGELDCYSRIRPV